MFRKIISALLLFIILTSLIPTASAQTSALNNPSFSTLGRTSATASLIPVASAQSTADNKCITPGETFVEISNFVFSNILWRAGFWVLDTATSFLETKKIAGFALGGVVEPIEQTIDFFRGIWLQSLIWGLISSVFNLLAGWLIEAGIGLNLTLSANNPLIRYGGAIILQITNFGLVLAIIVIGITTILQIKKDEYSADKLLFKLIIGIVLVNLTIPIVSSIADVGTRITESMYRHSSPCPENITLHFTVWRLHGKFQNLLGVQDEGVSNQQIINTPRLSSANYFVPYRLDYQSINRLRLASVPGLERSLPGQEQIETTSLEGDRVIPQTFNEGRTREQEVQREGRQQQSIFMGLVSGIVFSFLSLVAAGVMSFIAALTFLVFAIFLILRYVILMLLITFSPLIWLGFIFKNLKIDKSGNVWSSWWSHFLKWTFFGPIIILFLVFISEYLNSIGTGAGQGGGVIAQIGQLIAVIIISAIGIYAAKNFSGVAGNMIMTAATGGLGFIASKTQGMLKNKQMSAQMQAELLKKEGRHAEAKSYERRAKTYGTAMIGEDKARTYLKELGIQPKIKTPDNKDIRQKIIENKTQKLSSNPEDALNHYNPNDAKSMSPGAKSKLISAIRSLQDQHLAGTITLSPYQIKSLKAFERNIPDEISNHVIDNLTPANPKTILATSNAGLTDIGLNRTSSEKASITRALSDLNRMAFSLSSAQRIELARINKKIKKLIKDGNW